MKILTFIIPAYNSGEFLERCVDSIPLEALGDRLEVLIVNDGSGDTTGAIAERYAAAYPECVRVIHQENRGHGGAVNAGCAAATGKYMKIIDADDRVETEQVAPFLHVLEHCDSDVVLTHYRTEHIATGENLIWRSYPGMFGRIYSLAEMMGRWKDFDRVLTFHGITYKTSFYRRFAVPLTEGVFYEDHEYAAFPCCMAQNLMPLDLILYRYRVGDAAQSVSEENRLRRMGDTEAVLRSLIAQYRTRQEEMTAAGRIYVQRKIRGLLMSHLIMCLLGNPDRANGRKRARTMMEFVRVRAPEVSKRAESRYGVLQILHMLGGRKHVLEWVLHRDIYNRLRRNHDYV